jgi:hypothetical protein
MMMWKIVIGFIAFAALALYMLTKGGELDMGGEKHGMLFEVVVARLAA